ncbi:MAG: NADP-dependent oxidoreductase [Steroidobacteraceae bacterium]
MISSAIVSWRRLAALALCALSSLALAAPKTYNAVQIEAGGKPVLKAVAMLEPAAGQVRVRVYAVGVNPVDWKTVQRMAAGTAPVGVNNELNPYNTPGYDAAGVIDAIGAGVSGFKAGDAVIVWTRARGTYAEYVVAPAETVVPKPKNISFAEAAGIPHASMTAWNMLVDVAQVQKGQSVVVLGGSGGVGSAAVQIAKSRGARVISTASTSNIDLLKSLGVDQPIDYKTQNFEDIVRDADVVINTVDSDNANKALKVLKKGGILVSVGGLPSDADCAAAQVRCSNRTMTGTSQHDMLTGLARLAEQGQFRIVIDKSYASLAETAQAWEYSQGGHTRGKSVIEVGH